MSMEFSVLAECALERFENRFNECAEFEGKVFRRAWFIAFRRRLLTGKLDRCFVDIHLNDLDAVQCKAVALRNARNDISRAENVTEELLEAEAKALEEYRAAVANASVSLSLAFAGAADE